jgi:hypothetical protein
MAAGVTRFRALLAPSQNVGREQKPSGYSDGSWTHARLSHSLEAKALR